MIFTLPPPVLVVELALPDRRLSPNYSSGSNFGKAKPRKKYREASAWAFRQAMRHAGISSAFDRVTVLAFFYFKRGARRDGLNMQMMLKPAIDGMQDAGVVSDDRWVAELPPVLQVDKKRPRVQIHVYEGTPIFQEADSFGSTS